ncbi:hypothetical protein ACFV6E_13030 [Streptomyces sp. NPDC059785]|uniref:hypothetical protein n=1 Tax=unclassified Streptomyces TaxID=2593676 RepID=UPI00364F5EC5
MRSSVVLVVLVACAVVGVVCGAGSAVADEYHRGSDNGPTFGVVNTGQIDDPLEDVLEHTLLFGDGYVWE